ncbi:fused response regulator/phosphatase [Algicola sagamiensis]|uniref:fused response regulator/phosphatase n=1 Tax=Algicola sagamiensis TaxID=163869 RepID=UPI000370A11C|nr:fused response regulator/phosphatase [Algicola sagamiensis]
MTQILVVDDQEINRTLLMHLLMEQGYEVIQAENGEEALAMYESHQPDCVMLDIMMPVMDGYETAPKLKELAGDAYLPIIFITALDDQNSLEYCLDVGGDDFLTKPFERVILQAKVKAHLRSRELYSKILKQKKQLEYHQRLINREHEIVEHIYDNALRLDATYKEWIDAYISSADTFNGDLAIADISPFGSLYIFLGDFTGHGLAAAVGALPLSKVFHDMVAKGLTVADISLEINGMLRNLLPDNMFCAACILEMSHTGKTISMWLGGLPDVYLLSKSGKKHAIESAHMALGVLEDYEFNSDVMTLQVEPGDRLVVHTDGLTEQENAEGEYYGEERLHDCLFNHEYPTTNTIIDNLHEFCGTNNEQQDDITCIFLNCKPIHSDITTLKEQDQFLLTMEMNIAIENEELKELDPVKQLVEMMSALPFVERHRSIIFLILSEMYNNALEHGVLGLSSSVKDEEDGFIRYYEMRTEALENMKDGRVDIDIHFYPQDKILKIGVTDSGAGFDFEKKLTEKKSEALHGRGLDLIHRLTKHVGYELGGRRMVVEYHLLSDVVKY